MSMSQIPLPYAQGGSGGGEPLGVLDALGLGWQLMKSDFWPLWTAALALLGLMLASNCIPFGTFIAAPPLFAGFMFVLARRIDGQPVKVGELLEGFRSRFIDSIVSMLPVLIVWLLVSIVEIAVYFVVMLPMMVIQPGQPPDMTRFWALYWPMMGGMMGVSLLLCLFQMFFVFAPIAVWQTPHHGWEAAKISMRLVLNHLGSMLGLLVLGWLIMLVAEIVGCLACLVGILFTIPAVMVWLGAAVVFVYRSWMGQPLVQTVIEPPGR